jgi:lipopolysaccharide transport system ATP-binding protein
MGDVAVRIEGLGKQYRIGEQLRRFDTFGEALMSSVTMPFKRMGRILRGEVVGSVDLTEIIWALRDISFEVKKGEVVGIIGFNGAGKSTLLKILSRITEPSEGFAEVYGRVGALLEVGTGFHPELTGRENVYLNGSILGMTRSEIDSKFDEIVAFSGIEQFVDTPIKHYSSGMGLRLGFAVAAHLEPEILIVDEVLAVGDAAFQAKCIGKMGEVANSGRTVLFVSHNMSAVVQLCSKAYLLEKGRLKTSGDTMSVIQQYLSGSERIAEVDLTRHDGRRKSYHQLMTNARLFSSGMITSSISTGDSLTLEVDCQVTDLSLIKTLHFGFLVRDGLGTPLFSANTNQYKVQTINNGERTRFRVHMDQLPLAPGTYTISLYLGNGATDNDVVENAITFDVLWTENPNLAYPPRVKWGPMYVPVQWEVAVLDGLLINGVRS